ncbi:Hypothetical_protein [Hexamita inflata]|uniref:Hypothetical_protein n=1 Tax=Hexamita inflata TaxID=28002 RepID=A0AA86QXX6_9EUKA|nr:Hypothetical protein HINF_LOCUS49463 [Hexamita inflata]
MKLGSGLKYSRILKKVAKNINKNRFRFPRLFTQNQIREIISASLSRENEFCGLWKTEERILCENKRTLRADMQLLALAEKQCWFRFETSRVTSATQHIMNVSVSWTE